MKVSILTCCKVTLALFVVDVHELEREIQRSRDEMRRLRSADHGGGRFLSESCDRRQTIIDEVASQVDKGLDNVPMQSNFQFVENEGGSARVKCSRNVSVSLGPVGSSSKSLRRSESSIR